MPGAASVAGSARDARGFPSGAARATFSEERDGRADRDPGPAAGVVDVRRPT